MFYLTTHSTHFIYGYMASDIWLRTILIMRKETRCRHIGYSYRLTARVLLYAPSQDRIAHTTAFVTPVVEHWLEREITQWVHPMKDRSDDPSHHERTLLPGSYISLLVQIRVKYEFRGFVWLNYIRWSSKYKFCGLLLFWFSFVCFLLLFLCVSLFCFVLFVVVFWVWIWGFFKILIFSKLLQM